MFTPLMDGWKKKLLHMYVCIYIYIWHIYIHFLGGSREKNPPEIQEMWVLFLGWKDPLEEEMPTHSSILSWEIPWMEGVFQAIVHGVAERVGHDLVTKQQQNLSYLYTLNSNNICYIYTCTYMRVCHTPSGILSNHEIEKREKGMATQSTSLA